MEAAINDRVKYLMIQGTGSHVGKSVIVAALCRIFANRGYRVAPFKAQNMALNSFVTADGREIGRSTAVQAFAARTEPRIEMNPILIKPKSETSAQVMLLGKPLGDVTAMDAFCNNRPLKETKWKAIQESLETLSKKYDLIVIEGAGSPAEVNLREFDLVNMAVAREVGASVFLVADIDRGGAFAALIGTWELFTEEERNHVRGFIINKFRGDERLLQPALKFLNDRTGHPVVGVIPYDPGLSLMEEDYLKSRVTGCGEPEIEIAVVEHRHLSNFTDMDPLAIEPGVMVRYVRSPVQLGRPDAIILPGTKNTIDDLRIHYESGLAGRIQKSAGEGIPIIGICGGYQMMGKALLDPLRLESDCGDMEGLNLLEVVTEFRPGKITKQVGVRPSGFGPFLQDGPSIVRGYEIHSGETRLLHSGVQPSFLRVTEDGGPEREGAVNQNGFVFGSAVHGLFENDTLRRRFVNVLRERKGLTPLSIPLIRYHEIQEQTFEDWARWVESHLDLPCLEKILIR